MCSKTYLGGNLKMIIIGEKINVLIDGESGVCVCIKDDRFITRPIKEALTGENDLSEKYKVGDLLIVRYASNKEVQINDEILMYKVESREKYDVIQDKIVKKVEQGANTITYILENEGNYAIKYYG